jgi:hypothetical protein
MQEKTAELVTVPTYDVGDVLASIFDFFINYYPQFLLGFKDFLGYVIALSIVVSFILLLGIIFTVESLKSIRRRESKIFDAKIDMGYETVVKAGDPELTNRWNRIVRNIESPNENDWRQAIIEADVILADILTKMGYKGDGIGEQLKRVVKGDFESIDQAWEAHKIRNTIAHSGTEYILNQMEARRVINLYKQIFEEFYYI